MRSFRRLRKEAPHAEFVFVSERGSPFSPAGLAKMVERAGKEAGFAFKAHPHMLRHACGYKLANDGKDTRSLQAYLGHRTFNTRCAIRNWRRTGSRIFGGSFTPKACPIAKSVPHWRNEAT